jgi:hypothetical protein
VSFLAATAQPDFITWVRPELSGQGWTEESIEDSAGGGHSMHFRRGPEALEILLVTVPQGTQVTYLQLH